MTTEQKTTNTTTTTGTTTQQETKTPAGFNLSLQDVQYDEKYTLNSGSLGQLMRSFVEMQSRISSEGETDAYKKALYPPLRALSQEVLTKSNSLLLASSEKEREVRRFNLFGFNGRVKKIQGRYPFVPRLRPTTTYKYANFGDLLKVVKQRCEFISTREVPQRYVDDVEEGAAFTKLRNEVTDFLNYLKNTVDTKWSDAVTQARNAGGQQVQQNLERRSQNTNSSSTRRGRGGQTRGRGRRNNVSSSSAETNDGAGAGAAAVSSGQEPRISHGRGTGTSRGGRGRGRGRGGQQSYSARSLN